MGKSQAMVKTSINYAFCDQGNIIKQRKIILGSTVGRQNRDRDRGVGDAMLDVANEKTMQKTKEVKCYGNE